MDDDDDDDDDNYDEEYEEDNDDEALDYFALLLTTASYYWQKCALDNSSNKQSCDAKKSWFFTNYPIPDFEANLSYSKIVFWPKVCKTVSPNWGYRPIVLEIQRLVLSFHNSFLNFLITSFHETDLFADSECKVQHAKLRQVIADWQMWFLNWLLMISWLAKLAFCDFSMASYDFLIG